MLRLHGLVNLSHLDGGRGRAAEMNAPPPLPDDVCLERQLDKMAERPTRGHSNQVVSNNQKV